MFLRSAVLCFFMGSVAHAFVAPSVSLQLSAAPCATSKKPHFALRGAPQRHTALLPLRMSSDPVPSDDTPLTLTAYDQLLLSVKAMSVKEIKQELTTREVDFADCFEKEELVARLVEARLQIAAEALGEGEIDAGEEGVEMKPLPDEDKPKDAPEGGGDPGLGTAQAASDFLKSMDPAKIQRMLADQELIAAIKNPTVMQMAREVMQDKSAMQKYQGDPDVLRAIEKIKAFMEEP
uniref:STI1 domain-containing protein n=1 Tax=Hemiselmis tepida TaxID=464990 RepID=A0A7S0Z040_9CRYP